MPRPTAITRDSGDRDIDALRSLSLVRVDLRPDADGDGEHFAEFEYGLAPEDIDARLVAVDRHRARRSSTSASTPDPAGRSGAAVRTAG